MAFERVAVLGPGLLGGSVGLACRERGLAEVVFWGRNEEKLAAVREAEFEAGADLAEVVRGVDLVVLATPVEFYEGLAAQLVEASHPSPSLRRAKNSGGNFLVTDVGSVKEMVHAGAGRILEEGGIDFIGSHPMAGSEKSGFGEARVDLFEGAGCFLTNDHQLGEELIYDLREFWEKLGCLVSVTSGKEHDSIVARISHLPHALAVATARVALRNEREMNFGGGGLRDTTRVAAGDAAMWRGILMENREAVLEELGKASKELEELRNLLENERDEDLQEWLQEAKTLRDKLC